MRRAFAGLRDKGLIAAGSDMVWLPVHPAAELLASMKAGTMH